MKLSLKIAALIGFGVTLLMLVVSLLSLRRDLKLVEQDIARDAQQVATSIAIGARGLQPDAIRALVHQIEDETHGIQVRYQQANTTAPPLEWQPDAIVATVPIPNAGAIQVVESLAPRDRLLDASLRTLSITTVFVMMASLGGGLWLGRWLVGRRVDALVRKARRVARGDFEHPVLVGGADELTVLGTELNLMAGQLEQARMSSKKDAEARLEAEVQLRHADRLRTVGQLAAGIAHELGTPLNVIAGRASLLLRGLPDDTDAITHATTIREQTQRITSIVRLLMDYSRVSPSKREPTELQSLVEETVQLLKPKLAEKQIQINIQRSPTGTVIGDVEQLRQVLTNLIVNASDAVELRGRIDVTLKQLRNTVLLRVEDDGPGIPEQLRERVLEPFYTSKAPGDGTGLGLSVVEGIVRDHGGTFTVGAAELGGARFNVELPLETP